MAIYQPGNLRRACDRCYRIKLKCTWTTNTDSCDICTRLRHHCETKRDVLRPGRRPSRASTSQTLQTSQTSPESNPSPTSVSQQGSSTGTPSPLDNWDPLLVALKDFQEPEIRLMEYFLDDAFIGSYMYGASFRSMMRSLLLAQFLNNPKVVKDAYLACAGALAHTRAISLTHQDPESNLRRSARSLQVLRAASSSSQGQKIVIRTLALSVITFNHMVVGQSCLPVAQSAILADPSISPLSDYNIICILFIEIVECLALRIIPLRRYESPSGPVLDRYVGVCHEILPHLYDICVLAWGVKTGSLGAEAVLDSAAEISAALEAWDPNVPLQLWAGQISRAEMRHYSFQAHVYRAAAQLILCYLKSGFEDLDSHIVQHSRELRLPIEEKIAGEDFVQHGYSFIAFPYFVACVECHDTAAQGNVLDNLIKITAGTAMASCQREFDFLKSCWETRNTNPNFSWFDLFEQVPSIGVTV